MPFLGWWEYDGVELVNDERAARYAEQLCGDAPFEAEVCGVAAWLGYRYGAAPAGEVGDEGTRAPWYSPDAAADAGALIGFAGLALDGLEGSPRARQVTPAVSGHGGLPGPETAGPRDVEARIAVFAATGRAAAWGVNWLASLLAGGRAPVREPDPVLGEDGLYVSDWPVPPRWAGPTRPGGLAPHLRLLAADPGGAADFRTLHDVVLTEGPVVEARHELPGPLHLWEVTATLTAGVPWLYRRPQEVALGLRLAAWPHNYGQGPTPYAPAGDAPITWVPTRERAVTPRGVDADGGLCGASSGCPAPVTVPPAAAEIDRCAATTPMVPRWVNVVDTRDYYLPARAELVPIIVVTTGNKAMRRFSIRIGRRLPGGYDDPMGLALRWELNVPFLPAGSRLVLDGRTQTAVVHCGTVALLTADRLDEVPPGQTYEPAVYGIRSSPVVWPAWLGAEDLRITAHAEDDFCATNATVSVSLAARVDTA